MRPLPMRRGQPYTPRVHHAQRLLQRHDPCSWLPEGGVADVIADESEQPPRPTPVVRLLVTSPAGILTIHEPDGRLGIPTARVADDPQTSVVALTRAHLVGEHTPLAIGYVRNHVPGPAAGYPWPTPFAHFAVWHCAVGSDEARQGSWLELPRARAALGERHWWPLAATVI